MRAKAGGGVENPVATKMPKERRGGGLGNKKKKKKMQLTDITNTRNGARPSKRRKKSVKKEDTVVVVATSHGVLTRSQKKAISCLKSKAVAKDGASKIVDAEPVATEDVILDLSCDEKLSSDVEEEAPVAAKEAEDTPQWVNIDMIHMNDEKYPIEYAEDIYNNAREAELKYRVQNPEYMTNIQTDISQSMRGILVDWLIEVADEYRLDPKTLHLSVSTIDRVLSKRSVSRGKLQLVGCACMLLAGKYEEIFPPTVEDYSYISDNTYTPHQVLAEERRVLRDIDYNLTVPTMHMFLSRFLEAAAAGKKEKHLAQYFCEIALLHLDFVKFVPSKIAAAAVFYMRLVLPPSGGGDIWNVTLQHYTRYVEDDLRECCGLLHAKHLSTKSSELKAVYEKFELEKFSMVAHIEPLRELPF